jgi:hypothetical protein
MRRLERRYIYRSCIGRKKYESIFCHLPIKVLIFIKCQKVIIRFFLPASEIVLYLNTDKKKNE